MFRPHLNRPRAALILQTFILSCLFALYSCGGGSGAGKDPNSTSTNITTTPTTNTITDTTLDTTDTADTTSAGRGTSHAVEQERVELQSPADSNRVVIDLLVVYNQAANEIYAGSAETRVNHLIDVSNQIFVDSKIDLEIRAVYIGEIAYEGNYDSSTALDHITFKSHPAFSEIDALRANYGADMVVLMRPYADDGSCGMAWIGGYGTEGDFSHPQEKDYAYAHIAIDCGTYLLAHELGHNMGLNHSRLQDGTGGTYEYALGHGQSGNFVTVMASPSAFSAAKIKLFSNPDLSCNGSPCGVSREDANDGADAAHTLNQVSRQIAAYFDTTIVSGDDAAKFDADGDGISDLLLRHVNGMWNLYLFNESLTTNSNTLALDEDVSWQAVSRSDFNGDGFADLLVRNQNSGEWHLYLLQGDSIIDDSKLALTPNTGRQAVSTQDFDGDGRADILLRDSDGSWHLYILRGTSIIENTRVRMSEDTDAVIIASGDFNGDHSTDVLLGYADGSCYLYLLKGAEIIQEGPLPLQTGLAWQVVATGDFNGNGRDDLLLRNDNGQWSINSLNGLALDRVDSLNMTDDLAWQLATTGDFNGDGNVDVLLRNQYQGNWFLYLLSNLSIVSSTSVSLTDDLNWNLAQGN